ncbi:MAG: hypothetical protein KA180_05215 [Gemmatimonadales bacterium]|nr:hypothetical protein [Gemmatimonadales bacterium]
MNQLLLAAAVLTFVVGLGHSVLGEHLIFRRMRQGGLIPTNGGKVIGEGHVRILWASWHTLTVFGWCMGLVLVWLARAPHEHPLTAALSRAILVAMLLGAALVFVGTKAKHPGWAGLLGVAVLIWLAGP